MLPPLLPLQAQALLALADGTLFEGISIGATGHTVGEVVFNTALTGYQEILTDPSYCRQIVTLTYPHIGNTGVNDEDVEANGVRAAGLIVRDLALRASNFRSTRTLAQYLRDEGTVAIADIDTRKLTRILRTNGAQSGCIVALPMGEPLTPAIVTTRSGAPAQRRAWRGSTWPRSSVHAEPYEWTESEWALSGPGGKPGFGRQAAPRFHVVAYDFGIKRNILRMLASRGCRLTVVPAQTPAADVLALAPDGLFLSNGPGDPAALRLRDRGDSRAGRARPADLRHLPRAPDPRPGLGCADLQDEVRPPRCEPSGEGPRHRARQHHEPEPRLRGRRSDAAGDAAAHAREPVRRHAAGPEHAPTGRRSASRGTPRRRPARTTSATCSTASWA